MLNRYEYVTESNNHIEFLWRWLQNCAGRSTLIIHLPRAQKHQLERICKTIQTISKKTFSLSDLARYQLSELQKRLELNPNLYNLLKLLRHMDENPVVERSREEKKYLRVAKIRLSKQQILNLEATLEVTEKQLSKHEFTVEKTIETLLLGLCFEMNTKQTSIVYEILESLDVEKEEVTLYLESKD